MPNKKIIRVAHGFNCTNSVRQGIKFEKPSLTKQAPKEECDLNRIVGFYQKQGLNPHREPFEGEDYIAPEMDFKTALDMSLELSAEYQNLSPEDKALFPNEAAYAAFLDNPDNLPHKFDNESSVTSGDSSVESGDQQVDKNESQNAEDSV